MIWSNTDKQKIKSEIVKGLENDPEVRKIVVFGSFLHSLDPADVDIAIFQDSAEPYLELALKYRKQTRAVSRKIPVDIIPLRAGDYDDPFLDEVDAGEIIYER
jgi:predicted nucleotidyltransferase